MRNIIFLALFTIMIALSSGCAVTGKYGNYIKGNEEQQTMLANDAATQISVLYPPAKTRLALQQSTVDAFGIALVKTLRNQGYALIEFDPKAKVLNTESALSLHYVLDEAGLTNLYRLTLMVGDQSITRPYVAENGMFEPVGYWSRKE